MWHVLHLIARPIAALLGAFCVLTAIVLYPDEEGKIQSKFEDFWIRVHDFQNAALTRHAAFMTQVAKLESRFLDQVFGHKLISPQSVAVSICCSTVSWYLVALSEEYFIVRQPLSYPTQWMICVFGGSTIIALASILRHRNFVRRALFLVGCSFIAGGLVPSTFRSGFLNSRESSLLITWVIGLGFICDVAFIAATRKLIRLAGEMRESFRIIAVLLLDLFLAASLTGSVLLFHLMVRTGVSPLGPRANSLIYYGYQVSRTNVLDAVFAVFFILLALTLLLHRALWPLLTRTLFRMADIGTKGRRAILTTAGMALLAAGISGKVPELVQKLIEKLGG